MLIEGGLDYAHDQTYPVSGLEGNLWRAPTIGVSVGISSIAEFQIDGGFYDRLTITHRDGTAPLASALTVTGDTTHDVEDIVDRHEDPAAVRKPPGGPHSAFGSRRSCRTPRTKAGSARTRPTFWQSMLVAKTVQSVRVVGNVGFGILADPTRGDRQNDVLTYGLSFARAVTQRSEFVGELNGRKSTRSGDAFPRHREPRAPEARRPLHARIAPGSTGESSSA